MKTRSLSAFALLLILALSFYLGTAWVTGTVSCLIALSAIEWHQLVRERQQINPRRDCLVGLLAFAAGWLSKDFLNAALLHPVLERPLYCTALLFWTGMFCLLLCEPCRKRCLQSRMFRSLSGGCILLPLWAALLTLLYRHGEHHPYLIFHPILITFCVDTGAYIVGRRFGKHRFCKISPGKTWEGVAGGILCGLLYICGYHWLTETKAVAPALWLAELSVLPAAILGDLVESLYKRFAGQKESGYLLPGHGGLLDRFDSLSAALPIYLCLHSLLSPWS